jgi:hypothetical protein
VWLNTDWTGAGSNTTGFACNPQAIACGSGLPLTPPEGATGLSENVITLPGIGLSVANYTWFSLAYRNIWTSWDVMFGASVADTTAGVVIKSS